MLCPYATHLDEDEEDSASFSSTSMTTKTEDLVSMARKSCPAFAKSSTCPFSGAKTADEIRQTLIQVPASHYDPQENHGFFLKALKHIHVVSRHLGESEATFAIQGGCPIPQDFRPTAGVAFVDAMEQFSFSAIISSMAQKMEAEERTLEGGVSAFEDDEDEDEKKEQVGEKEIPDGVLVRDSTDFSLSTDDPDPSSSGSAELQPPSRRLSHAFKTGTAAAHQAAENVHFVRNFVRGKIDRALYADLVLSLYHVYHALEEELDRHAPIHFGNCHFPHELNRCAALEDDVHFWHGDHTLKTQHAHTTSPATKDYIERLRSLGKTRPRLLLAHAYTRYLGDLSGGKVLARVARRALNLGSRGEADGLAFYDFPNIPSVKLFKDRYRQSLDSLDLSSPQEVQELVEEANVAFLLNMRLFEELDVKANVEGARVRSLHEVYETVLSSKNEDGETSTGPEVSDKECPFLQKQRAGSSDTGGRAARGNSGKSTPQKGKCPWPFILLHDWRSGLLDYKTWILLGFLLCWMWQNYVRTLHR